MNIKLNNIGILKEADIDFNGIAVIGGLNDTGKSTVGKVAYAIIRACTVSDKEISIEKRNIIRNIRVSLTRIKDRYLLKNNDTAKNHKNSLNLYSRPRRIDDYELEIENLIEELNTVGSEEFKTTISDLIEDYNIWSDKDTKNIKEKTYLNRIQKLLDSEFNGKLSSAFNNKKATIDFTTSEKDTIRIYIDNKEINVTLKNFPDLLDDIIYINSPLMLSNSYLLGDLSKELYLNRVLRDDKKDTQNTFEKLYEEIQGEILEIISGKMKINDSDDIIFQKHGVDFSLDNTATGIKMFGIIQMLLEKRRINNSTLLILDEPEVHLHTEWQVKLAEILVLISQKLQVPMLISTHSGFMIEALNLYAKYYEYDNFVKYYLASHVDENDKKSSIIKPVESWEITDVLSNPFVKLEELEMKLEKKGKL